MDGLIMAAQLTLGLSILVFVHEMGHFLAAKMFGIKVEKFYIFFDAWGVKLFKKNIGGTEFGIGWLPIGGYVKIAGMVDESMDKEQLQKPAEPWEFRAKPAWQRLIVMVGGVTMNIMLGMGLFIYLMLNYGEQYIPAEEVNRHGIIAHELGQAAGLQTGDKIVAINGEPLERFEDLMSAKVILGENTVFTVIRNGERKQVPVPGDFTSRFTDAGKEAVGTFISPIIPFEVAQVQAGSFADKAGLKKGDEIVAVNDQRITMGFTQFTEVLQSHAGEKVTLQVKRNGETVPLTAQVGEDGKLGFHINPLISYKSESYGFGEAVVKGSEKAWGSLFTSISAIGKLFTGDISPKSLQGPIGIATVYGAEWDWQKFWTLTAVLSMWLAFINMVPIPALDGGHVLFLTYEMVTGHKPSDKFLEVAQVAGMVILLMLMVFVIGNDIVNLF